MIEIDGKAIPLESGKKYLLLYDDNYVSPQALKSLDAWFAANDIEVAVISVSSLHPNVVRLIDIEKPETPA